MAEPTNTDALHQGNEPTEEMQLRSCCPGPGAGLPVEHGGPLLGRRGALQPSSEHCSPALQLRSQPAGISGSACCGYPFQGCVHTVQFQTLNSKSGFL